MKNYNGPGYFGITAGSDKPTAESVKCAFCKRPKGRDEALCHNCFYALPYGLRKFLYRPKGDGFEGALETGLEWLNDKYGEKNASQS